MKRIGLCKTKISGLATYVPPKLLTNNDLEKMVDTTDEWILQRTGIRERHIVEPGVATSDLAKEASLKAIAQAGLTPADIGFIVARAEIDFKLQIEMEPIDICIRITEMRTTSFDTVYEIRKRGGKVAATGKVVVVLFDWKAQTKMPISDELRQKVRALQQETAKSI